MLCHLHRTLQYLKLISLAYLFKQKHSAMDVRK